MLDFCLIYVPKPYLKQPDAQQPLGLLYIASSLKKFGRTVVVKNYSAYSYEKILNELPYAKIYGITSTSLEIPESNRIAKLIKSIRLNCKVILGGPGAYATDYIDFNYIDSIVQGEGENIIHGIYLDAICNRMKRIYQGTPVDVDAFMPDRDFIENKGGNIFANNKNYYPGGSTVIISSRGCPFKCAFCSAPVLTGNQPVRFRNPKKIREEIKYCINNYGIKQFRFSDDMFTANKKHVKSVCDAIGDLDIAWRISCRVKPLSKEMLKMMLDAGCKELSFGIESFDNNVLKGLNKNATALDNVKAINMSKEMGFVVRLLFMIRTPFQTKQTIKINKQFINNIDYDTIACTAFVPIPGCDIWYNPDKYNIEILDRDLEKYNFYMYDSDGRRKIDAIIKIKNRPLDEFTQESEDFRDWLEQYQKVNKG